jgi:hypothetical protein
MGSLRMSTARGLGGRSSLWALALIAAAAVGALSLWSLSAGASPAAASVTPNAYGGLDCNGYSTAQHPIKSYLACRDLADPAESDDRFWDGEHYIGHDEPDLNFTSAAPGSGDDVTWTFTIGKDPAAQPTDASPGHDISHYFELTPALWFSMNICDPDSYPLLPCTPESDTNAPKCVDQAECNGAYPGGGSAFMELQFYPPGFGPWVDAPSFDNKHWGAALTVDSLESTQGFTDINEACVEPVNFSFIQKNGVPPGPPSPQLQDFASNTPNAESLLMNPGDKIRVHVYDAPAPGGGKALMAVIDDLTTGESGYMQASAANGFMNTSISNCDGTPFNFQPEYSTAKPTNLSPWGAGTEIISASFETGHWEPCTKLAKRAKIKLFSGVSDTYYNECKGPYEEAGPPDEIFEEGSLEPSDAYCFPEGDTHGALDSEPDTMTGCEDNLYQNGDLDFDGSPYWTEWPTSTTPTANPSTFQISPPTTVSHQAYAGYQFQTDVTFSELSTCTPSTPSGCTAPPPIAPGKFYPYWTLAKSAKTGVCTWEFGNVQSGETFGGDAEYGTINENNFPDLSSRFYPNSCSS